LDDLIVGAYQADPNGKSNAGKSYVVFGKTDSTAINLSAIASGTGGFVINDLPRAPTIKSFKPSPLTSPAVETELPLISSTFSRAICYGQWHRGVCH
jgi:hypothetical protein